MTLIKAYGGMHTLNQYRLKAAHCDVFLVAQPQSDDIEHHDEVAWQDERELYERPKKLVAVKQKRIIVPLG